MNFIRHSPAGIDGAVRQARRTTFPGRRGLALLAGLAMLGGAMLVYRQWARVPPKHYVTVPASRGPVAPSVSASGTVNPENTVQVGTYVSGTVRTIYCDFNTAVHRGQICAKIDPRPYQSLVDQQMAGLESAIAQKNKDAAYLTFTALVHDRDMRLARPRDVAQQTLDFASSAYEQARAEIVRDDAAIRQQTAALNAARVNLDYCDIVSPVDGTVISRNVSQGQTVAASFQTPTLFVVATDLARMQIDTNVGEADIDSIKPGGKALFTVSALPTTPFFGIVRQIRQAPQMVQNVVTYDVVIGVDNHAMLLKPGMTAIAHLVTAEHDDALRVPSASLRYLPESGSGAAADGAATRGRIWVLRDGRPRAVPVAVGLDDDLNAEVLGGALQPGEPVIVAEQANPADAAASP